ncbi:hypothetical protein HYH03_013732 [Edaphochlamys debaryana]|uniref:Uncharacterized protein n=1 Tax=Edaphochlamys debaryana TaxID=47281 RepID=A0A835XRR2_9CHLO|nr:hypothetical protein HYH03_013732 [Edaphochlamys debaryana]|eukprot:KAG2487733.1 hypothetical protein HYH03_013732 [Edaphochlamys debaryana]
MAAAAPDPWRWSALPKPRSLRDEAKTFEPEVMFLELLSNSLEATSHLRPGGSGRAPLLSVRLEEEDPEGEKKAPALVFEDNGRGMSLEQLQGYFKLGYTTSRLPQLPRDEGMLPLHQFFNPKLNRFGRGCAAVVYWGNLITVSSVQEGQPSVLHKVTFDYGKALDKDSWDGHVTYTPTQAAVGQDYGPGTTIRISLLPKALADLRDPAFLQRMAAKVSQAFYFFIRGFPTTMWERLPPELKRGSQRPGGGLEVQFFSGQLGGCTLSPQANAPFPDSDLRRCLEALEDLLRDNEGIRLCVAAQRYVPPHLPGPGQPGHGSLVSLPADPAAAGLEGAASATDQFARPAITTAAGAANAAAVAAASGSGRKPTARKTSTTLPEPTTPLTSTDVPLPRSAPASGRGGKGGRGGAGGRAGRGGGRGGGAGGGGDGGGDMEGACTEALETDIEHRPQECTCDFLTIVPYMVSVGGQPTKPPPVEDGSRVCTFVVWSGMALPDDDSRRAFPNFVRAAGELAKAVSSTQLLAWKLAHPDRRLFALVLASPDARVHHHKAHLQGQAYEVYKTAGARLDPDRYPTSAQPRLFTFVPASAADTHLAAETAAELLAVARKVKERPQPARRPAGRRGRNAAGGAGPSNAPYADPDADPDPEVQIADVAENAGWRLDCEEGWAAVLLVQHFKAWQAQDQDGELLYDTAEPVLSELDVRPPCDFIPEDIGHVVQGSRYAFGPHNDPLRIGEMVRVADEDDPGLHALLSGRQTKAAVARMFIIEKFFALGADAYSQHFAVIRPWRPTGAPLAKAKPMHMCRIVPLIKATGEGPLEGSKYAARRAKQQKQVEEWEASLPHRLEFATDLPATVDPVRARLRHVPVVLRRKGGGKTSAKDSSTNESVQAYFAGYTLNIVLTITRLVDGEVVVGPKTLALPRSADRLSFELEGSELERLHDAGRYRLTVEAQEVDVKLLNAAHRVVTHEFEVSATPAVAFRAALAAPMGAGPVRLGEALPRLCITGVDEHGQQAPFPADFATRLANLAAATSALSITARNLDCRESALELNFSGAEATLSSDRKAITVEGLALAPQRLESLEAESQGGGRPQVSRITARLVISARLSGAGSRTLSLQDAPPSLVVCSGPAARLERAPLEEEATGQWFNRGWSAAKGSCPDADGRLLVRDASGNPYHNRSGDEPPRVKVLCLPAEAGGRLPVRLRRRAASQGQAYEDDRVLTASDRGEVVVRAAELEATGLPGDAGSLRLELVGAAAGGGQGRVVIRVEVKKVIASLEDDDAAEEAEAAAAAGGAAGRTPSRAEARARARARASTGRAGGPEGEEDEADDEAAGGRTGAVASYELDGMPSDKYKTMDGWIGAAKEAFEVRTDFSSGEPCYRCLRPNGADVGSSDDSVQTFFQARSRAREQPFFEQCFVLAPGSRQLRGQRLVLADEHDDVPDDAFTARVKVYINMRSVLGVKSLAIAHAKAALPPLTFLPADFSDPTTPKGPGPSCTAVVRFVDAQHETFEYGRIFVRQSPHAVSVRLAPAGCELLLGAEAVSPAPGTSATAAAGPSSGAVGGTLRAPPQFNPRRKLLHLHPGRGGRAAVDGAVLLRQGLALTGDGRGVKQGEVLRVPLMLLDQLGFSIAPDAAAKEVLTQRLTVSVIPPGSAGGATRALAAVEGWEWPAVAAEQEEGRPGNGGDAGPSCKVEPGEEAKQLKGRKQQNPSRLSKSGRRQTSELERPRWQPPAEAALPICFVRVRLEQAVGPVRLRLALQPPPAPRQGARPGTALRPFDLELPLKVLSGPLAAYVLQVEEPSRLQVTSLAQRPERSDADEAALACPDGARLLGLEVPEGSRLKLQLNLKDAAGYPLSEAGAFTLRASPRFGLPEAGTRLETAAGGVLVLPELAVGFGVEWLDQGRPKMLLLEPACDEFEHAEPLCVFVSVKAGRYPTQLELASADPVPEGVIQLSNEPLGRTGAERPGLPLGFEVRPISADGQPLPPAELGPLVLTYESKADGEEWEPSDDVAPEQLRAVELDGPGRGGGWVVVANELPMPRRAGQGLRWRLVGSYQGTAGRPSPCLVISEFSIAPAPPCRLALEGLGPEAEAKRALGSEAARRAPLILTVDEIAKGTERQRFEALSGHLSDWWGNRYAPGDAAPCRVVLSVRPEAPPARAGAAVATVPVPELAEARVDPSKGRFALPACSLRGAPLDPGQDRELVLELRPSPAPPPSQTPASPQHPSAPRGGGKRPRRGEAASEAGVGAAGALAQAQAQSGAAAAALPEELAGVEGLVLRRLFIAWASSAALREELQRLEEQIETENSELGRLNEAQRQADRAVRTHDQVVDNVVGELQRARAAAQAPQAGAAPRGVGAANAEEAVGTDIEQLDAQLAAPGAVAVENEPFVQLRRNDSRHGQEMQARVATLVNMFRDVPGVLGPLITLGCTERQDVAKTLMALSISPDLVICTTSQAALAAEDMINQKPTLAGVVDVLDLSNPDTYDLYDLKPGVVDASHPQGLLLDRVPPGGAQQPQGPPPSLCGQRADLLGYARASGVALVGFAVNLVHLRPEHVHVRVQLEGRSVYRKCKGSVPAVVSATLRQTLWHRFLMGAMVFEGGEDIVRFREYCRANNILLPSTKLVALDGRRGYNLRGRGIVSTGLHNNPATWLSGVPSDQQCQLAAPQATGGNPTGGALDARLRRQQLDRAACEASRGQLQQLQVRLAGALPQRAEALRQADLARQALEAARARAEPRLQELREARDQKKRELEEVVEKEKEAQVAAGVLRAGGIGGAAMRRQAAAAAATRGPAGAGGSGGQGAGVQAMPGAGPGGRGAGAGGRGAKRTHPEPVGPEDQGGGPGGSGDGPGATPRRPRMRS